jgi:hypothetical protein
MAFLNIELKLDKKQFPLLESFKKKDMGDILLKIFSIGYDIYFPSNENIQKQIVHNQLLEKINSIKNEMKEEMNNSDISIKLSSLESTLTKLIGLSSNSNKKGNFGENVLEEIFAQRYGDIKFERKSSQAHSGDAWLYLPDDKIIMLEIKNYTTTVNKDEVAKLRSDMINHHIKWGVLASFNSNIQGMKEMDYYTFTHNKEIYSVVMISNLSTDIHKLDLGLQIIRKLMSQIDTMDQFPWVVKDINSSLLELDNIVQKNYMLRDDYYSLERDIQKSLSTYHTKLRDYQYDIEMKTSEIIGKIKSTMNNSIKKENNTNIILKKYQDKKIYSIVVRILDTLQTKKWVIDIDDMDEYIIKTNENIIIGNIKIQAKKAIINITNNDLTITLHLGKEKENKQNLDIINSL